ncbi:MAG: class I SAM-dependent methyltransferase [Spirulina sp.]
MLIKDENQDKKADEIKGEEEYNTKVIPPEVHEQRNIFEDSNSQELLNKFGIDLSEANVLIVGCSFSELEFFHSRCKKIIALDIVPNLVQLYASATKDRGLSADWVCGDGECLPFEEESFDFVIIRQALHHMLKYYSAIFEFFRVCKIDGKIIIIDEPMTPPLFDAPPLSLLPDDFRVYEDVKLADIRKRRRIASVPNTHGVKSVDTVSLEIMKPYIEPQQEDAESLLADKYLAFSLLESIFALRLHTEDITLFWPDKISWTEEHHGVVKFVTGKNPNSGKSLVERLSNPGNISILAQKTERTSLFRDRSSIQGSL